MENVNRFDLNGNRTAQIIGSRDNVIPRAQQTQTDAGIQPEGQPLANFVPGSLLNIIASRPSRGNDNGHSNKESDNKSTVLYLFLWRASAITQSEFCIYWTQHVTLLQEIAGGNFPLSYSRTATRHTDRNAQQPAPTPLDPLSCDACAKLIFADIDHYEKYLLCINQPENKARITASELNFLKISQGVLAATHRGPGGLLLG